MATATDARLIVSKKSTQWRASRTPRPSTCRRRRRRTSASSRPRSRRIAGKVRAASTQRQKTSASPERSTPATMTDTKPQLAAIPATPAFQGLRRTALRIFAPASREEPLDARAAGGHRDGPRPARPPGEPVRPLRHSGLPARRAAARTERAGDPERHPAVRGDGVRRRARRHLPALLPRPRVQPRALPSQRHAPRPGGIDRPRRERRARPDRRRGRVRGLFRGSHPGRGDLGETLSLVAKAIAFIALSLAASRWLARPIDRLLDALPREFFLLFTFALLIGMSAIAKELGLSEAIGALMAGVVLAETSVRGEIEERFLGFRDVFAALFFFVFGLSIDVEAFSSLGWLIARGEFTVILAQVAATNQALAASARRDLVAFAGLYVLATALVGVVLMKESKRLGRRLFPGPAPTRLATEGTHGDRAP